MREIALRLHQQLHHVLLDFGAAYLEQRGFRPDLVVGLLRRHHAQIGPAQVLQRGARLGDAARELRVAPVVDLLQPVEALAAEPDAGRAGALVPEQVFGAGPPLALVVNALGDRHADILEDHLVEVRHAAETLDRAHRDSGQAHVDQQDRDAVLLLAGTVRAHQRETPVRPVGVGRPDLAAVDDVMVAVAHRAAGERGQVRAGIRLRIALAPDCLAGEDARQVARLLLLGAEGEQHGTHHLRAEGHRPRRAGEVAFLLEDEPLRRRPAGSAGGFRPVGAHPAALGDGAHPVHDIIAREQAAVPYLVAHILREPFPDEGAHLLAEGAVPVGNLDLHDRPSLTRVGSYGLHLLKTSSAGVPVFDQSNARCDSNLRPLWFSLRR